MPDPCVLGVDLGGTAIKLGLFSLDGDLLAEHQCPTPQPATPGAVCMEIVEATGVLDPDGRAPVVGIGLPGPMDAKARIARVCINLPGWEEVLWRPGWNPVLIVASLSPMTATVRLWVRLERSCQRL